jgi:hypothetical protein
LPATWKSLRIIKIKAAPFRETDTLPAGALDGKSTAEYNISVVAVDEKTAKIYVTVGTGEKMRTHASGTITAAETDSVNLTWHTTVENAPAQSGSGS